jgi:tRNA ligase
MNRSPRQPSATTKLVEELLAFGKDDAASAPSSSLDREAEDVAANRNKAHSSSREPVASTSRIADGNDDEVTARLSKLSLKDRDASAPQPKPAKPAKSLKNLLRSTSHTIRLQDADGTERKRVLTSWKMADYAYKRDPCPFPTRARGLFTERVKGDGNGEDDEYRIVARGYDKFFNVGEVSWTHVSFPFRLPSQTTRELIHDSATVGHDRTAFDWAVRAHDQVERLHHPHRRSRREESRRHFEA